MREILFRGKNKVDGEWSIGSLTHDTKYGNCFIEVCVHQGICEEVIPETVGQYTGLTDKNGRKIFEGDILLSHLDDSYPEEETILEVVWHNSGWYGKDGKYFDDFDNGFEKYFEVIGNIHDNPELLKE